MPIVSKDEGALLLTTMTTIISLSLLQEVDNHHHLLLLPHLDGRLQDQEQLPRLQVW